MANEFDLGRFTKPTANTGGTRVATGVALPQQEVTIVTREVRLRKILAGTDNLPSLPSIVTELVQLANDPGSGAGDFEELVRTDQSMAARILRLVNSPFFGISRDITNLSQAIVILGVKSLKSVVLAASTNGLLDGQLGVYGYEKGGLWAHSVATGTIARNLARAAGYSGDESEDLFAAGLLHDVGKVVLSPHLTLIDELEIPDSTAGPICWNKVESEYLGINHCEIAERIGEKWSLPKSLVGVIVRHHDPIDAAETRDIPVIQLADLICNRHGVGLSHDPQSGLSEKEESLRTALGFDEPPEEWEVRVSALVSDATAATRSIDG